MTLLAAAATLAILIAAIVILGAVRLRLPDPVWVEVSLVIAMLGFAALLAVVLL
jgi:hypothetical protein